MAAPTKKPPRAGKGTPPAPSDNGTVVGNNTSKADAGDKVTFNTRVPGEWKKRLKVFAAGHDLDMVDIMMEAVDEYLDRKGAPKE